MALDNSFCAIKRRPYHVVVTDSDQTPQRAKTNEAAERASGQPGKLLRPWDVAATPLQLALARGHRWLAMLESGKVKNLTEIAALEGVDNSYVSRIVNLTTLAPDIVKAILEDALPDHLTLVDLAVDPSALWEEQRLRIWSG